MLSPHVRLPFFILLTALFSACASAPSNDTFSAQATKHHSHSDSADASCHTENYSQAPDCIHSTSESHAAAHIHHQPVGVGIFAEIVIRVVVEGMVRALVYR